MSKKNIIIIAGPNGAGKTTLAPFLHSNYAIEESVNPDIIADGLSLHPQTVAFQSGRIALTRIKTFLAGNKSFAYETTLASHTVSHILKSSHRDNYHVSLHFLALPSAQVAKQRVEHRVSQGGHDIPDDVIERRFKRGLANFLSHYQYEVDEWVLYDALDNSNVIAYRNINSAVEILLPNDFNRLETYND